MKEKRVPSVWAIYIAAGVWAVCALILPLYRLSNLLITAALAAVGYLVAARLLPHTTVQTQERPEPIQTGDAELDRVLTSGRDDLMRLRKLNERIPDEQLSAQIGRMERAGQAILQEVEANPEKAQKIRRFINYYLPTAVKLLDYYAKMNLTGIAGGNIEEIRSSVAGNAEMIASAFEAQLDALYADEALDISTDIEVLDGMLASEGLKEQK